MLGFKNDSGEKKKINFAILKEYLKKSERPIVLAGYGIHLSNTRFKLFKFLKKRNIPAVFTYGGTDLIPYEDDLHIGKIEVDYTSDVKVCKLIMLPIQELILEHFDDDLPLDRLYSFDFIKD